MAVELAPLPSNILTTKQYEEQQAKLLAQDQQLDRDAFLKLFTTQLRIKTLLIRWKMKPSLHN